MTERIVQWLSDALAILAGLALIGMMLQTCADVLMSNVAGAPIEGNLEVVSVYHMVAVVFLPLAMVERKHEHIHVELVTLLLPKHLQTATYVAGCLLSAAFFGVMAWQTLLDAIVAYKINEIMMGSIYVTIWPARFFLPLGFGAILLTVLLHAWRAIRDPDFNPVPQPPELQVE